MKVQVLRGIPGSGKTRYVRELGQRYRVHAVSADHFFTGPDGTYNFVAAHIDKAHRHCLRQYLNVLRSRADTAPDVLVVDNTNASVAEIAPYMALADAYEVPAEIVEFACDPAVAAARNIHGVPAPSVQKIHDTARANDQLIPLWWRRTVL